jgi:hypothetical protein
MWTPAYRCEHQNEEGHMKLQRIVAVLAVGILWTACGSETPVAPDGQTGSAGGNVEQVSPTAGQLAASVTSAAEVIYACYAPKDGKVYRIKEPGLEQECKKSDTEFSWTSEGQQGPPGPPGGLSNVGLHTSGSASVAPGGEVTIDAVCPSGQVALSGAYTKSPIVQGIDVLMSLPQSATGTPPFDRWMMFIKNFSASTADVTVFATCADAH